MINPVQSGKILTLKSKALLSLCEAVIYSVTPPSTLIIPMQVQPKISPPPAVRSETHTCTHKQINKASTCSLAQLPGCTYSAWVAQRTLVTVKKKCTTRFSQNANKKPRTQIHAHKKFILESPLMLHWFSHFFSLPSFQPMNPLLKKPQWKIV